MHSPVTFSVKNSATGPQYEFSDFFCTSKKCCLFCAPRNFGIFF